MPRPAHRSRSMRRVFRKLPGGRTTIHYRKKRPSKPKCGSCGAVLVGVSSERAYKMQGMSKSKKRPSRPFGGMLCGKCTKNLVKKQVRKNV